MYVKSLSIKGFKSFADPVTLDLQPGVNVVVGPNGSGKSNVIDAVAWVLGAQGARALRGGKMDDVIFAGSGKRAALGRAEVSLTIDNSDQRIPVEFSEVTITRTLFRTGESEYALNGVSCRLLDIQDLLSDSGVGRQQHVIVSQGNLDAVLAARPEDRRMIIEEAAGVLKHRKRRERSQRRLEGTEVNLERLADLVREVRQQMRPLQKQADAARRHGAVSEELRATKLWVAGRDIERLEAKQQGSVDQDQQMRQRDQQLRAELVQLDTEVITCEKRLSALGVEDFGEHVERLQSAKDRANGAGAVLVQRRRTLDSELSASVSKDVVASLEHDEANTKRDLESVTIERDSMAPRFDELATSESALALDWLTFEGEWGEGLPMPSNDAAELRAEAGSLRSNLAQLNQERDRRAVRADQATAAIADINAELLQLISQREELAKRIEDSERSISVNAQQLATVSSALEAAVAASRQAESEAASAQAKVDTLTAALDASRARAGVERLAGVSDMAATLLELVEIDSGYESAFEAGVGEALSAVVVESSAGAKAALEMLRNDNVAGAVLPLSNNTGNTQGQASASVNGADALLSHVRGTTPAVTSLLGQLIGDCVVISNDIGAAVDFAVANPSAVVVTTSGDRFARNGWRVGQGGQGATKSALNDATAQLQEAQSRSVQLREAEAELNVAHKNASNQTQTDEQLRRTLERELSNSESSEANRRSRLESLQSEQAELAEVLAQLQERLDGDQARLDLLEERLPALEAAEASSAERAKRWKDARKILEDRSNDLRSRRAEIELRASSLDERKQFLSQRLESLTERLERHRHELAEAAGRRVRIEAAMSVIDRLSAAVRSIADRTEAHLNVARQIRNEKRQDRQQIEAALRTASSRRSQTERELMQLSERRQAAEVEQAELRVRIESLLASLASDLGVDLDAAKAAPEPELPAGVTAKARITELEREIKQMGLINPLALQELEEVEERHGFLQEQLDDIQKSRKELMQVIKAVDEEIVEVFRVAFDDVANNFNDLFGALFPGGSGKLSLTDPDNLLETGIEIEAKPSGKNVRTLSLLSGGERSLAALAFLFAVFRSRPSPFYLLDEVEAALDDVNLHRFLTLLDEFRGEAQLVVVSHQKRTMEKADCLYGVTMQPGGSSKVVSERIHVDLADASA